jgi:hypothetical protein
MRGAWIVAAALLVGALSPGAARAGVYFTTGTTVRDFARADDPDAQELWPLPSPFNQFHQDLADYRAGAVAGPNHERYLRRVKELEAKESRGALGLDDGINLGAYYIRLGKYPEAVRVLEAKARASNHFMLWANLATAHELAGDQADRAQGYRELALKSWPAAYPGWDSGQLSFYRKAEQYHQTLLQERKKEARLQPRRNAIQLDNLFPRVQFVGASPGERDYQAGSIAPALWAEIPTDATNVVMQLLLWMPFDDRLHWLLGELLNAGGDVTGAAAMMKEVVNKAQDPAKWDAGAPPELRKHYEVVKAVAAAREGYAQVLFNDPYLPVKLVAALTPRGGGLGAGDLIREASWPAFVIRTGEQAQQAQQARRVADAARGGGGEPAPGAPAAPPAPASWEPNWRQLGVGFGAGALVALLLGMQVRQMGRPKT